jgi:WD40 repeat protein
MDVLVLAAIAITSAAGTAAASSQPALPRECRGFLQSGEIRLTHVWGSYALAQGALVDAATFSHDSQFLFTGGVDGSLRAWVLASCDEVWSTQAPNGVEILAITPDDHWVLGGTVDGRVSAFDAATGHRRWSRRRHAAGVLALDVSVPRSLIKTRVSSAVFHVHDRVPRAPGTRPASRRSSSTEMNNDVDGELEAGPLGKERTAPPTITSDQYCEEVLSGSPLI